MKTMPPWPETAPVIRPLDHAVCAALGHVGYVEDRDPVEALSAMFRAVATPPVNAVLWADAGADIDPAMLRQLRIWRDANDFKGYWLTFDSYDDAPARLRKCFNAYSGCRDSGPPPLQREALMKLHDHLQLRLAALRAAIPAREINMEIRASGDRFGKNFPASRPHIDSTRYPWSLRLLEPLESDPTIIFSNEDFECVRSTEPRDEKFLGTLYPWQRDFTWRNSGNPTAWQIPRSSLLMITNHIHPWKPVLHSEPPCDPSRPESNRRIVISYDLVLEPGWMAKAAAITPG